MTSAADGSGERGDRQDLQAVPARAHPGQRLHLVGRHGKAYTDFVAGIAVCDLGHAHPNIAEALAAQAQHAVARLQPLLHAPPDRARPPGCVRHSFADRVFFCNSGAEANEAAIKLVRKYFKETGQPAAVPHRQHGAVLPWPDHGDPLGHRTGKSQARVRPVARGFRLCAVRRPGGPAGEHRTRDLRGACSSRCKAKAACAVPNPTTSNRCARCATRPVCCSFSTRSRPGWAAPARSSPTSIPA